MSAEFWLRFEPQILSTGLAINFLFVTARAERKVRLCVNTHSFDLKFVAFCPKFSGDSWVEFQEKTIPEEFSEILCKTKAIIYRNL